MKEEIIIGLLFLIVMALWAIDKKIKSIENLLRRSHELSNKEPIDTDSELKRAIISGNKNNVDTLIKGGADINEKDEDGSTPLMIAIRYEHKDIINTLIKAGADIHEKNDLGETAVGETAAIVEDCKKILDILIKAGANINDKDDEGMTALMWAAELGCKDNVSTFIKAGANINEINNNGETALMLAEQQLLGTPDAERFANDREDLKNIIKLLAKSAAK